jgi:hypothetical protein
MISRNSPCRAAVGNSGVPRGGRRYVLLITALRSTATPKMLPASGSELPPPMPTREARRLRPRRSFYLGRRVVVTVPVNHFAGPLPEGCVPFRLISMALPSLAGCSAKCRAAPPRRLTGIIGMHL